ncbi:Ada metal-binding domain-containing protein [Paraburkholderia phenazinium]|uniref:Ada metal-binding domain-containing protein n=1 Tax=Paraburkholderia sp. TaxID=1926495 RepID=UPI000EFB14A4
MRYIVVMNLDREIRCKPVCSSAVRSFGGRFSLVMSSSGIYCRPLCPVRWSGFANCRFYVNAA